MCWLWTHPVAFGIHFQAGRLSWRQRLKDNTRQRKIGKIRHLVAVRVRLERPLNRHADVVSLLLGELGEVGTQRWQVKSRHLLIQPWMIYGGPAKITHIDIYIIYIYIDIYIYIEKYK